MPETVVVPTPAAVDEPAPAEDIEPKRATTVLLEADVPPQSGDNAEAAGQPDDADESSGQRTATTFRSGRGDQNNYDDGNSFDLFEFELVIDPDVDSKPQSGKQ